MTTNMPFISIVIPTYDRAYIIHRAIQSVLNQTYKDFEVLVVDDGSTDNTHEIVASFNDKRIRYLRHDINRGVADARNTGITAAIGEYLAFLDSDAEWLPKKLGKQVATFKNSSQQIGVVYTGCFKIVGSKKIYKPSPRINQKEGNIHDSLLSQNFIPASSIVVRRECFSRVGLFDRSAPPMEDWDMWMRISKHYLFKCIDEPLAIGYQMPDSISIALGPRLKARERILESHFEDIKKDKSIMANYYYTTGCLFCSNGEFKQGWSYLVKAFRTTPLNVRPMLAALASIFGQGFFNKATVFYDKIRDWWFSRAQ